MGWLLVLMEMQFSMEPSFLVRHRSWDLRRYNQVVKEKVRGKYVGVNLGEVDIRRREQYGFLERLFRGVYNLLSKVDNPKRQVEYENRV